MGRGLEGDMEDSLTELRRPWQVRGSRRVQPAPSFLCCLPIFPARDGGGALRSVAEAGRPRPPPPRQPPEDSCPNMELGFPRPRPRPRPAGRPRLAVGRRELLALGAGNGMGEGILRCRPRSSWCPGTLPQFPLLVAAVN